jgi:hypothetical protein
MNPVATNTTPPGPQRSCPSIRTHPRLMALRDLCITRPPISHRPRPRQIVLLRRQCSCVSYFCRHFYLESPNMYCLCLVHGGMTAPNYVHLGPEGPFPPLQETSLFHASGAQTAGDNLHSAKHVDQSMPVGKPPPSSTSYVCAQ